MSEVGLQVFSVKVRHSLSLLSVGVASVDSHMEVDLPSTVTALAQANFRPLVFQVRMQHQLREVSRVVQHVIAHTATLPYLWG